MGMHEQDTTLSDLNYNAGFFKIWLISKRFSCKLGALSYIN